MFLAHSQAFRPAARGDAARIASRSSRLRCSEFLIYVVAVPEPRRTFMNRFARVLLIAMTTVVLSAASVTVSAAGSTVSVQRQGMLTPGHLRPVSETAVQGDSQFFGQYYDWFRFYVYLFWNSKLGGVKS
jgi:hypothetical protein